MAELRTRPYRVRTRGISPRHQPVRATSLFGDGFEAPKFNMQSDAAKRRAAYKRMTAAAGGGGDSLFGHVGNLLGNLAGDVKDTAVGLVPGLWETVQHPIRALENTVEQYKTYYGPLFDGDIDQFSANVEEHPLQFILDALPVAAAAGKAVQAGRIAKGVEASTRNVEMGVGSVKLDVQQTLSLDPYKATWQRLGSQVQRRLPVSTPIVGAANRLAKDAIKMIERDEKRLSGLHQRQEHAVSRLTVEEREAANYIAEGNTDPDAYRAYLNRQERKGRLVPVARDLKESEIARVEGTIRRYRDADEHTRGRLNTVIDITREANEISARIDKLDPEAKRWRDIAPAVEIHDIHGASPRLRTRRPGTDMVRAVDSDEVGPALPRSDRLDVPLHPDFAGIRNKAVRRSTRERYAKLSKSDKQAYLAWAREVEDNPDVFWHVTDSQGKMTTIQGVTPDGTRMDDVWTIPSSMVRRTQKWDMRANYLPQVDAVVQEVTGVDPTYVPHRPYDLEEFGPIARGRSSMSLFRGGGNMPDIGLTIWDMQSSLKKLNIQSAHKFLRTNGRTLDQSKRKPRGWVFVKDEAAATERLPFDPARAALERGDDGLQDAARQMFESLTSEERPAGESAIIVPKSLNGNLMNRLAYEAGSVGKTIEAFNSIWKAMVLSLTPRFITTNVSGNAFLYGINHPTWMPQILKTYVRRFYHDNGIDVGAETKTLYEHFPQHTKGMGVEHRVKDIMASPRKRTAAKFVNWGYYIVGYTEEVQREALMVKLAMREPAIKQRVQAIIDRGGARDLNDTALNQAMREVFDLPEGDAIYTKIADEIDRVMGDYRNYSQWERRVRMFSPFYGWLRHIARTTGSMVTENPAGLTVISAISDQAEPALEGLPSFMAQYIGAGDIDPDSGVMPFIDTKPYNPMATIADELATVQAALGIGAMPGNLPEGSNAVFGPLISGAVEYLTGESLLTGAPVKDQRPGGILTNVVLKPFESAGPLSILRAAGPESMMDIFGAEEPPPYTASGAKRKEKERLLDRDPKWAALSWLGLPYKVVDTDVALDMGRKERGEKKPTSRRKLNQANSFGKLGVLDLGR